MKKIKLMVILFFLVGTVTAQTNAAEDNQKTDKKESQTLFKNPSHVGWYVAPDFAWTQFDNRDVYMGGISGGVIFDHTFSLGLAGYGIMNSNNLTFDGILSGRPAALYGGYGGLKMEYRIQPSSMVHIGFPLLIGGGGLFYGETFDNWDDNDWDSNYPSTSFFVVEPGVMAGINLIRFMRLDLGASYRLTSNLSLPQTGSDVFNGFNLFMSLKFGKF
jgi:hypothetical protein